MNISEFPNLLLSLLKLVGQSPAQENTGKQNNSFLPGQQYEGQVLGNLANGRSLVQVDGQKLDMLLPQSAKPGDTLNLTYLQSGTRPTFAMASNAASASSPVVLSQTAQQISALTRYVPVSRAGAVQAAPGASASTAAASAANSAAGAAGAQAAGASSVVSGPPILSNPAVLLIPMTQAPNLSSLAAGIMPAPTMSGEAVEGAHASNAANTSVLTSRVASDDASLGNHMLPVRLQQTVKESGLFYESHLGKWARGEMGLESLHREPQARLAQHPGALLDLPDLEGMPEKAAQLAGRQLNMLDGQPFVWQGQVWPGQNMEWLVGERDGGEQDLEAEAQKWHSQLNMTLPRMGGISADLDIGALGLRIRLGAQSDETLAEMKAAMPELAHRLKLAGLNLTSVVLESNNG